MEGKQEKYSDEHLISKMQEDIETGLALIMEQYAGLIWSVCGSHLQNPEDIKECVNDTFAKFALDYKRFHMDKGSLRNYLCKIAEHCAVDKFRYNMREKQKEDTVLEKISRERADRTSKREVELLGEALEKLEPIDSQILRMKYYDGLSFKEVAENLHMNYEVVKKRSQRSYKKLLKLILLGLLLGILAACAAMVFKQYRFSELIGFIWNVEDTAYGMEGEVEGAEVAGVWYTVSDAVYYDRKLKVEFTARWLGETEEHWSDEFKQKISDFLLCHKVYEVEPGIYQHVKIEGITSEDVVFDGENVLAEISISSSGDTATVLIYYEKISELKEEDGISATILTESGIAFKIAFSPLPIVEYEHTEEKIELSDGSSFVFGTYHVGEESVVVGFEHINPQEYEVAPLISNNYRGMGTWSSKTKNVVLIDKDGNEISTQRIQSEDSANSGIRRHFQLHFPKLESGTYTLQIPYVCLLKDAMSETISLELPTEDGGYEECDKNVLFEDGSGYRIMGIRCEKNIVTWENLVGNDWVLMEETEWRYYITYEVISKSNLELCFAEIQGVTKDGAKINAFVDEEGRYYFSVKESALSTGKPAESAEIQFLNPVYVLDEMISTEIVLQEE